MTFAISPPTSSFSKQIWVVPPLNPSNIFSYDWSPLFFSQKSIDPPLNPLPSPQAINSVQSLMRRFFSVRKKGRNRMRRCLSCINLSETKNLFGYKLAWFDFCGYASKAVRCSLRFRHVPVYKWQKETGKKNVLAFMNPEIITVIARV